MTNSEENARYRTKERYTLRFKSGGIALSTLSWSECRMWMNAYNPHHHLDKRFTDANCLLTLERTKEKVEVSNG